MNDLFQMLTNTADGAFVIDEDQYIVFWNEAAQEILGYTSDEVIGRPCYEILGGQDDQGCVICHHHCVVLATTLTRRPVTNYDIVARTKLGKMCWINVSILTIPPSNNNTPPLIVHLFRDATQKKQNEQFIRQVLNAANRLQERPPHSASLPTPPAEPLAATELTDREREVLSLLAQGLSTDDIGQALSISSFTVRNHVQNILNKLQVHSRLEAVSYAFEHGLVTRD